MCVFSFSVLVYSTEPKIGSWMNNQITAMITHRDVNGYFKVYTANGSVLAKDLKILHLEI